VSRSDLPALSQDLESEALSALFEAAWDGQEMEPELARSPSRLLKCLLALHRPAFVLSGVYHVVAGSCLQLTPFALSYLLQLMERREAGSLYPHQDYLGYLGCIGLFGLLLVKTVLGNQGYYLAYKTGLKIRSSLSAAIFHHMLEMSNGAKQVICHVIYIR